MFVGGGTVQAAGGFKKIIFFSSPYRKTSNIGFETVHVFHSTKN